MDAAVTLLRLDPTRNMRRFYRLDVQRDLFGQWCLVSEWGRIGCAGQMQMTPFDTAQKAKGALARRLSTKQRRGYFSL